MSLTVLGCGPEEMSSGGGSAPIFVEGTARAGLSFRHDNGMSGERYIVEMMGGGVGLLDYDGDGDLDVYLTQGHALGPGREPSGGDRLFRNDSVTTVGGRPALRFTDVTVASGIQALGYGMGVATGDYDGDGHVDVYVTNFGPNQLLRNRGDGTFEDVTGPSGTGDPRLSIAAAFLDYDRDGQLDLLVGNYLDFRFANHRQCPSTSGFADYCGPRAFTPQANRLYRNQGDGSFANATASAGMDVESGYTLGLLSGDFNDDGWVDMYEANDGMANRLWLNRGDGTFQDRAILGGCAVNADGQPEGSMGVDAGDFDMDGDDDLFMTHLDGETNTLYVNRGEAIFEDRTVQAGLAAPSFSLTGFGVAWLDYDNDGWLDLMAVNGAVTSVERLVQANDPFPLHQPNQLFRNLGQGRFEDVTAAAGPAFELSEVSRGAAFGDLDNDGDTDVVVFNNGGELRLLVNEVGHVHRWCGVIPIDKSGRAGLGDARVLLIREGSMPLRREAGSAGSYASASDPRVLFGLGDDAAIEAIEVRWPDGSRERFTGARANWYNTLRQGEGSVTHP